ncbi:uncharacterized protein C13orf46 homolog isoform X2 [Fukomys damarensis]|uniref:uncharacterized protein C13orf46 homolog isoform X2 n=1 Tax=Fukomys damarensis TaxID=885580 RepID=UPI00053F4339|nr:uncharacterized protein C13orf46 homolog isoform X2 [Fukomys damarensis]
MEKDPAAHRRHRPGPGALPSGAAPGLGKAASEGPALQRSRSVGGLIQKGDPPSRPRNPCREPESEDQDHDPRRDTNNASGQADLEEDGKEKNQDAQGTPDPDSGKAEPETEWSGAETSTEGEQEGTGWCSREAEEQELEPIKLVSHLEKEKPPTFVEIDLGDHTEEVIPCAVREEMQARMDTGDLSEDEIQTSWLCCIPYTTRRKTKCGMAALEKGWLSWGEWGADCSIMADTPSSSPTTQD